MIACQIFDNGDRVFAYYYYNNRNLRTRRFPIWDGEMIEYDISSIKKNLKNHTFRGYSWEYVAKFIEYFRAIDGWQKEYHPHHFRDILKKVEREIKNERHLIR